MLGPAMQRPAWRGTQARLGGSDLHCMVPVMKVKCTVA
jgi:hypothetical protein